MAEYDESMNWQAPPPDGAPVYPDAEGGTYTYADYQQWTGPAYAQPAYVAQPVVAAVPPQRDGRFSTGAIIGLAVIIAVCIVMIVGIVSCSSTLGNMAGSLGLGQTEGIYDDTPAVGVINVTGTIQYDGTACSPGGLRYLLDEAERDDSIKAVVLRVDSGGGVATAGEEMAHYVKEFSKPIVVSSASTNASAAYEISSQADYIFTAKTTAMGAIGVALQVTDLSGLYEKLGIRIENIVSADSKDATYGTRPLTSEERAWYQSLVDQIDNDFITTVAEGRDMKFDEARKLANGLTYTGIDAVDNGLADEVGYLEEAIAKASDLAGFDATLEMRVLDISAGSRLDTLLDLLGQSKTSDEQALEVIQKKLETWK